jgi:hypothetical protein
MDLHLLIYLANCLYCQQGVFKIASTANPSYPVVDPKYQIDAKERMEGKKQKQKAHTGPTGKKVEPRRGNEGTSTS